MKQKNQEFENETDSFIQEDEKKCMLDGQSEGERVKVIHDQLRYCGKLYKVLRNLKCVEEVFPSPSYHFLSRSNSEMHKS